MEKISKALADATRLKIFEEISSRPEITCRDIVLLRGVTPATVSHHLKILHDAGLIVCRKKGQFVRSQPRPRTIRRYASALAKIAGGKSASAKNRGPRWPGLADPGGPSSNRRR